MRRIRFDLGSDRGMEALKTFVANARLAGKRPVFELMPEKRTLSQNDMAFALYTQISQQCQDQSLVDIRRHCKLDYGVPIMCKDSAGYRELYSQTVGLLPYEKQLLCMDWFKVTSEMGKKTFSEFLDTVIREYSRQGYSLLHPSEAAA